MTNEALQETSFTMSEADMKKLVRNALMVAGQEMGAEGDHWPVIKQTITDIMRDWEELNEERKYQAEMKTHLYGQLAEMEEIMKTCAPDVQAEVAPRLAELREVYDAHFTEPNEEIVVHLDDAESDEDKPLHIRRAEAIIKTLEEDNG